MIKEDVFTLGSLYRDDMRVTGYRFGSGERAVAIVGSLRGNEMQQLYVASQAVRTLERLEADGAFAPGREVLVIPCGNLFSINTGRRFWALDGTDVNRMFPGYDRGETTQRIAAGIFEEVSRYAYGIQLASHYLPGSFVPHVRVMDVGASNVRLAEHFGLPFAVVREPDSFDTVTLHYNWRCWGTQAFSLFGRATDRIDEPSAGQTLRAIVRFLAAIGVLRIDMHGGFKTTVLHEDRDLVSMVAEESGFFRALKHAGEHVEAGEHVGSIVDPLDGSARSALKAPAAGMVFFEHDAPLIREKDVAFRLASVYDESSADGCAG